MRLGRRRDPAHRRAEPEKLERERPLRALGEQDWPGGEVGRLARAVKDRADPRGRVLQVRPGVTGQRQHPVEVEHVGGIACHRQVRVLQRADADRLGDPAAQLRVVIAVLNDFLGTPHGLVDQVDQLDRSAGPAAEPLPVGSTDQADGGVLSAYSLRQPAGLAGGREHHLKVLGLLGADHVDEPARVQVADPVPDRGHVRGVVSVASVGLAQDQGQRCAVPAGESGRECAQRPVADHRDARRLELVADISEHRVVEALRR